MGLPLLHFIPANRSKSPTGLTNFLLMYQGSQFPNLLPLGANMFVVKESHYIQKHLNSAAGGGGGNLGYKHLISALPFKIPLAKNVLSAVFNRPPPENDHILGSSWSTEK